MLTIKLSRIPTIALMLIGLLFTETAWAVNATLIDDTYVYEASPGDNSNSENYLWAHSASGSDRWIYLRFKVTKDQIGTAAPTSATLKLTRYSGPSTTARVYPANNGWAGSSVTWSSKHDCVSGQELDNAIVGTSATTVTFDVKKYISGPGEYTFCIQADTTGNLKFYSQEGSSTYKPALTMTKAVSASDFTRSPAEIVLLGMDYIDRYEASSSGGWHDTNRIGYFNVKSAPYFAKGDGSTDDTLAIQRAVNEARDSRMAVFFPAGTYVVSDTIECVQGVVKIDPNSYGSTYNERWNQREFANILIGPGTTGTGNRATLQLKTGSNDFSFNDPSAPKPVLRVWSRGNGQSYSPEPTENQLDININQTVNNIDIDLTAATERDGAVGIDMSGAQGTAMSSMTIKAGGAYAGIRGLPGPGGSTADVTIYGGKYGIDAYYFTDDTHTLNDGKYLVGGLAPLIQHCSINNSDNNSIRWNGSGTMVLVGCSIYGKSIYIAGSGVSGNITPERGNINIVDSQIELLGTTGPAVTGSRSVYMRNVYCKNVNTPAQITTADIETLGGDSTPAKITISSPGSWHHIKEYYDGAKLKQYSTTSAEFTPGYIIDTQYNGSAQALTPPLGLDVESGAAPTGFLDRHVWIAKNPLPVWALDPSDGSTVLNVKDSPYYAVGDGVSDDTSKIQQAIYDANNSTPKKAVFIPAGEYVISDTLELKVNTVLFGLNKNICRLKAKEPANKQFSSSLAPLMRSRLGANAVNDTTTIAELTLFQRMTTTNCYLLRWEAGANSTVQNVNFDRHFVPGTNTAADMTVPLVWVNETGGGKWYNFWVDGSNAQATGYRHFLLTRTTSSASNEPLTFYMFDPETDVGNIYCAEFINSWNINVYQSKYEGELSPSLRLDNCRNFRWFGFAGNAYVPTGSRSIELKNCYNFLLAGQSYRYNSRGPVPTSFYRVKDTYGSGGSTYTVTTPGEKKFVLYRRGNPTDPTN